MERCTRLPGNTWKLAALALAVVVLVTIGISLTVPVSAAVPPAPRSALDTPTATTTPNCAEWTIVPSPSQGSASNFLADITVISANDVWAVGSGSSTGLIMHWEGSQWSVVTNPAPGPLYGVSGTGANDVWAVGGSTILHWNGSQWTGEVNPAPSGMLKSVVAISESDAWAVGTLPGTPSQNLALHWIDGAWNIVPTPNMTGWDNTLNGVSAVGPDDVWAVGYAYLSFNQRTAALRWNGSAWTSTGSPSPGFEQNVLTDVAALATDNVWAVGYCYCGPNTPYDSLVIHWNGSNWTQMNTPDLGPAPLYGLSARAANDIWAVGSVGFSPSTTLIEHYDGTAWTRVTSPNGSTGTSDLNAVAVAPGSDVWAVGYTGPMSQYMTLVERRWVSCSTVTPTNTPTLTPTETPTGSPTITVTPCPITFTDVNPPDYFYEAVMYLACRGVISGYSDGTFRPYNDTTRGQLSKIVVLAREWPIVTPTGTPTFRDVPADNPFYGYIETAYSQGVISGYSCGTGCLEFRWANNVTRGQLTKVVVLAMNWAITPPSTPTFQDVPLDHPFYGYIETAYAHQIISGYSCGSGCLEFRPYNNATRGQIAKIVYNAVTSP